MFKKAVKHEAKLRMAISGASGSGKTFTALTFAKALAKTGRIAVVDTEHGSASKYADQFDFDVIELNNFHPDNYIKAIKAAEREGYSVIVLDSMTHAWNGTGGILEIVGGNFAKWKEVNPIERNFIEAIISSKMHVIATMRAKMQVEVEKDERGKAVPKKIGMGAIQRDGIEYEFDITCMMDLSNNITVDKTRCPDVNGLVVNRPGVDFMTPIIKWLSGQPSEPVPAVMTIRDLIAELKPQLATLDNVTDDSLLKAINETGKGQAYLTAKGKPLGFGTELSPSTYDAIKTQVLDALNKKGE